MFLIVRAAVYAGLFISFFFLWVPARLLSASGIGFPETIGPAEVAGAVFSAAGGMLALWCILMLVFVGRGTPAPFDPPQRLVTTGPYRLTRNPMYMGASVALLGVALFYKSYALLVYAIAFLVLSHLFVVGYEEAAVRRRFPHQYPVYCTKVRRWFEFSNTRRPVTHS